MPLPEAPTYVASARVCWAQKAAARIPDVWRRGFKNRLLNDF